MSCLEELFSVILRKLMPLGQYGRKRPPCSRCCRVARTNAACKSTRTGLPAPAPYPPFPNCYQGSRSSVSLVISRTNAEQAPRPRPSCFGPCPWRYRPDPPPSPQSGFCRRQTTIAEICQYARETIFCRRRICPAACGLCGRGVNGDSWYRQAVGPHKSNGRCPLTDAHACILWIVQPRTARNLFGRPVATEFFIDPDDQIGAAHAAVMAQPPAKAVWLRPGYPAISRSSSL